MAEVNKDKDEATKTKKESEKGKKLKTTKAKTVKQKEEKKVEPEVKEELVTIKEEKNDEKVVTESKEVPVKEENKKEKKKKEKKAKKEKVPKEKKPRSNKILVISIIVLLIVILLLLAYIFLLPLKAKVNTKGDNVTKTGYLDFEIDLSSNKPIWSIYYAFDPADENDLSYYTKYEDKDGLFSTKMELGDISIPVGERELTIYVKSLFGSHDVVKIPVEFKLGYIGEFDASKVGMVDGVQAVKDELIVTFYEGVKASEAKKLLNNYGGTVVGEVYFMNQYQVQFEGDITDIKDELEDESDIESVSYNLVNTIIPSANLCGKTGYAEFDYDNKEYNYELIKARTAYQYLNNYSPYQINVGVIDSPVYYKHEDLQINTNNIFVASDNATGIDSIDTLLAYANSQSKDQTTEIGCNTLSVLSHGTHVAGIIGAKHDDKGVSGITDYVNLYYAPSGYYSLDPEGKLVQYASNFAISFVLSRMIMSDVRVINMSYGLGELSSESKAEYQEFYNSYFDTISKMNKDFLIVKAAGNDNIDASGEALVDVLKHVSYLDDRLLVVGAAQMSTSLFGKTILSKASYSNYGDYVDIIAPGRVYSTIYDNQYDWIGGTSQATPQVAGAAALLYNLDPELTASEVKEALIDGASDKIRYDGKPYKFLDVAASFLLALDKSSYNEQVDELRKELEKEEDSSTKYGYITGSILDAKTNKMPELFSGAISFINNETEETYTGAYGTDGFSLGDGEYEFILPVGTYTMVIYFPGYYEDKVYNIKIDEGVTTYNVLLKVIDEEENKETGTAVGYVVDAFDGSHIPKASLKIYKGVSNSTEDFVMEIQADKNGWYEVSLTPGNYTAYVSANGYTAGKTNIIVLSKVNNNQDCTITPILKEGEIRAILTWGATPSDLDSHLVGPKPGGGTFHTYFENKNYYYNNTKYDNLDLDDTTSYGPETTSVYVGVEGTYTYYVHDYSNRSSSSSKALGLSGAQVKLFIAGEEEPIVFNVPNQAGTLWKVFTIENGKVKPVNEMSYHNAPISVGQ